MAYPVNHYPNDRFSDRLEAECARRGLTPTVTLPPLLDCDPSSVRQWLLGSTRPGVQSLRKLAALFGVPVDEWRALLGLPGVNGGGNHPESDVWTGPPTPEPLPLVVGGAPGVQREVCPDCHHALLDAGGSCPSCRERTRARRINRERLAIWKDCGLPFEVYLDGWYQQGRPFRDWLAALGRLGHIG